MGGIVKALFWLIFLSAALVAVFFVAGDDIARFLGGAGPVGNGPSLEERMLRQDTIPLAWKNCSQSDEWASPHAVDAMHRAAEDNDAVAQYALAIAYMTGAGEQCSASKGAMWMAKSGALGLPHAQYNMGLIRRWGFGADVDPAEALMWFVEAANQDHAGALNVLAISQFVNATAGENGSGFDAVSCASGDCLVATRQKFQRAARFKNVDAMANLGFVHSYIANQLEELEYYSEAEEFYGDAYFWYKLASLYVDDGEIRDYRDGLADRLMPNLVRSLNDRAAAWSPENPLPDANLPINTEPDQFMQG